MWNSGVDYQQINGWYRPKAAGTWTPSSSQSAAWLNRVATALSASAPTYGLSTTERNAYDAMITGMVGAGLWSKLDALWIFPTINTTIANMNLISTSFGITNHGCTFTADGSGVTTAGYAGNGTSAYLDPGYIFGSGTAGMSDANSAMGTYCTTSGVAASGAVSVGCYDGTYFAGITPHYNTDNNCYGQISDSAAHGLVTDGKGLIIASRTSLSLITTYKWDGSNAGSIATDSTTNLSGHIPSLGMYLLASNGAGGTPSAWYASTITAAFFCTALSSTQPANMSTWINGYMSAVGVNIY